MTVGKFDKREAKQVELGLPERRYVFDMAEFSGIVAELKWKSGRFGRNTQLSLFKIFLGYVSTQSMVWQNQFLKSILKFHFKSRSHIRHLFSGDLYERYQKGF